MITLDRNRCFGDFALERVGASGAGYFYILLDKLPVDVNGNEFCVLDFFALIIKARSTKDHIHGLPLARSFRGIELGCRSLISSLRARDPFLRSPSLIDSSQIAEVDFFFTMAIEDLNFIAAHEIDARV